MDPDETAPKAHFLSKRLQISQQMTKAYIIFAICALRVNKCQSVRILMKCTHFCAAQAKKQDFTNYK